MIRQAIRRDSAEAVPLIWQAIGDLAFVLTGTSDVQETVSVLSDFFQQEDNRLSYQNALVMEEEGQLVGLVLLYDGAKARELDVPLERAAAALECWSVGVLECWSGGVVPEAKDHLFKGSLLLI
jgi:hypothetical protein